MTDKMKKAIDRLLIIGGVLIGISLIVNGYNSIQKYGFDISMSNAVLISSMTSPISILGIILIIIAFVLYIKKDKK